MDFTAGVVPVTTVLKDEQNYTDLFKDKFSKSA